MRGYLILAACSLACIGCNKPMPTAGPAKSVEKDGHVHGEVGPSGGTLIMWGDEEYHAELIVEADKGAVTVNVLDGNVKKLMPINAKSLKLTLLATPPLFVTLAPKPNDGDPDGLSSRFIGTNELLKAARSWKGSLSVSVNGKNYTGDFEQKPVGK